MSKYRIPSTSSTLDPYDVQRRIAGDTLKPTASQVETSTVGNELETLTPFQIEEGRGTLGNSQFYQQALQNQLSNDEDFWSLTAKGLKNLAGTVVTEIGKTPGYIGGGLAAVGNELFSDGKDSMKMMVDNSWINAFESMNQSIKDFMPVHVKQEVLDGNVFDKLGSYAWWAETGAEGIGFMLAMYGPGALLKAGKVGQRIMGGIEELTNAGVKTANWLNLPMDAIKPYKMSLSTAGKVDGYAAALTNSVVESAAEAANTFDTVKSNKLQEYLNKGLTQEEAEELSNQDAGKAASAIFKTNMIILPISNLLEEKWLWKSIGLKGQDEASQGIINQFMKNGVLDLDGLKNATKKTFKEQAGTYSKNFLKNFAKEGGGEEGLQTITQQQVEKGNIKDNPLSQLWESISQYTNDFENNKELHESIALGGLLGGGASIFQSINEGRNNEEAIYGSKQGKFDNILNKIGLRQVRKDQRGLSNLLSENWIQNFRSYNDLMTDGKLDETKLAALPQEQQNLANLHFLYDSAVELGDKQTQEIVGQYLSANYAQPFLGQTGGKEIFRQHVENQVVPEWAKRFQEVNNREVTPVEINEYKKRFLDSANQVFDNYKEVEETHYPERYFQDKDNPEQYKDFKKFYFDQKFQALTNGNVADQLISKSNANLLSKGIVGNENLSGIQKTQKKIEEKNIENYEKTKQEASDYYESLFTKKGVKELYDLFANKRKVVEDTIQEVETDKTKDIKVAEEKVANLTTAETKFQEAESTQDTPITIKTKDGRVLETFVDNDGTRYVNDNSNVRPITEEEQTQSSIVQQNDVEREVKKSSGVEPEFEKGDYDKVLQLAKDNIAGVMQSSPENIQLLSNYPKLFEKYTKEQIGPNISNEEPIDEKLHEAFLQNDLGTGLYPSTGMHVSYDFIKGRIYDRLNSEGLPKLNSSVHQRNWFKALDEITNINDYQVKVVNKTSADSEQLRVIIENGGGQVQDTDLFIFLYKDDSAIIIDNNPVFTSLYRPDTLYKELGKQSLSARIAPDSIYEAYLNHLGINMPKEIDDTLSRLSDVDIRKLEEVIGKGNLSSTGLWNAAARWSKEDYTKWYNSLQQPNTFLQPINITNGKRLVRRNADRSIVWNKAEGNVPDFSIENQRLVNGDIVQQYTAQGVKAGNKFYNFRIGDSVLVSNDQAYRLKQSLLNADEAKSVLYLLSLKQDAPPESVKLPVRTVIKEKNSTGGYSDKVFEETPVFGSNNEYGLIKSLINFGFGTSKGSIYLHNNDIEFIDFEGNKNTIPVKEIQKAFLDDDFSKIEPLTKFLEQKRFNVNENLLRADSDFQYPTLKRTSNGGYTISFENKGKYKAFLLQSEKLLTDSVIAEGYPKRLARNLQFAKSPTVKMVEETKVEETQEVRVDPRLEKLKNRKRTEMPDLNVFSKITEEDESIIASEKTIRDLAARMSDRIGIPYRIISDRTEEYKGKIENNVAYVNLAYATLDTPIHEILGHPIIRVIKNKYEFTEFQADENTPFGGILKEEAGYSKLYQNLLKELEYGRGKRVLDRIKRDYQFKGSKVNSDFQVYEKEGKYYFYDSLASYSGEDGEIEITKEKYESILNGDRYNLEEQQEEALVTLLGLMTAEKLDNVKDGKLISLLKRLLKELKAFVRSLLSQREVDVDKLPDNMTLGDISDLLAYSNSKLILPGYEVEYTTPDNNKFKTYQEASNHISELAKNVKNVDLSDVSINDIKIDKNNLPSDFKNYYTSNRAEIAFMKNDEYNDEYNNKIQELRGKYAGKFIVVEKSDYGVYPNTTENQNFYNTKEEADNAALDKSIEQYKKEKAINGFIEKNKEYEQSKEIIEEWKKVNNIVYNPEEIYSRGQEFSSVVGAYSNFDVNLMMQNLLSHIEDNEKAGGKFAISAFTKPIDKIIGHLEGGGGKIKFKIYPQSNDILWATDADAYSGSVWDASEKINKNKKSELLGVSYTKYPSLKNIDTVQPNLASIIDNLRDHHNELGIVLTGNNFRLEYDDNIPYQTKKILNSINAILDQRYGRLVKPKIDKVQKEPKLLQWTIKPVGPGSKTEWALEYLYSDNFNDYSGDVKFFDTKEEAELFVKTLDKKSNQQIGIQPTQTNKTLKESIESVKSKVLSTANRPKSLQELQEGDGFLYYEKNGKYFKEDLEKQIDIEITKEEYEGKKEYTEQALINTKIAKLKEVAKKYPRSLIRSEVKRIGYSSDPFFDMFEDELPFSKITKNVSPLRRRIEELRSRKNKSLPSLNTDKILSPTDLLTQKLQSGEITKYCK